MALDHGVGPVLLRLSSSWLIEWAPAVARPIGAGNDDVGADSTIVDFARESAVEPMSHPIRIAWASASTASSVLNGPKRRPNVIDVPRGSRLVPVMNRYPHSGPTAGAA